MSHRTFADSVEILLFDLGGVLVHWDGVGSLRELTGARLSKEEARKFWLDSPAVRRFERGEISEVEFAADAIAELDLEMTPSDFLARFAEWDRGPFPETPKLLAELRPRFRLACLSNNNALAWPRIRDARGLSTFFERCYLSHEIGAAKPDREIFEFVLSDLKRPADRILFFDDNSECVESARTAGFQAEVVAGVEGVRQALRRRQLLP